MGEVEEEVDHCSSEGVPPVRRGRGVCVQGIRRELNHPRTRRPKIEGKADHDGGV